MNEYLMTPQHENYIGNCMSDKSIYMNSSVKKPKTPLKIHKAIKQCKEL